LLVALLLGMLLLLMLMLWLLLLGAGKVTQVQEVLMMKI